MKLQKPFFALLFIIAVTSIFSQVNKEDNSLKDNSKFKINNIHFSSRSIDWSAFCSFYSDGKVTGAHLSGNPPFVHEETDTVSQQVIEEIWKAALPVLEQKFEKEVQPDPAWIVYETIDIGYNDEEFVQIIWQTNPKIENPSKEVLKLKETLLKYRNGGW